MFTNINPIEVSTLRFHTKFQTMLFSKLKLFTLGNLCRWKRGRSHEWTAKHTERDRVLKTEKTKCFLSVT